jgi:hypothetical protein
MSTAKFSINSGSTWTDTSKFTDGSAGDTSTYEEGARTNGGAENIRMALYYGSSHNAIDHFLYEAEVAEYGTAAISGGICFSYPSTDGITEGTAANHTPASTPATTSFTSIRIPTSGSLDTPITTAYAILMLEFNGGAPGVSNSPRVSDIRAYDASGVEVPPVAWPGGGGPVTINMPVISTSSVGAVKQATKRGGVTSSSLVSALFGRSLRIGVVSTSVVSGVKQVTKRAALISRSAAAGLAGRVVVLPMAVISTSVVSLVPRKVILTVGAVLSTSVVSGLRRITKRGGALSPSRAGALKTITKRAALVSRSVVSITAPQIRLSASDVFAALRAFQFAIATLKGKRMIALASLLRYFDIEARSIPQSLLTELQAAAATMATLEENMVGDDGISGTLYGAGDQKFIATVAGVAGTIAAQMAVNNDILAKHGRMIQTYNSYLAGVGQSVLVAGQPAFTNIDSYLSYVNNPALGGALYAGLVSPNFALIWFLFNLQAATGLMSPGNVYAPATTLGTVLVGPGAGAIAFTDGASIRTVNDGAGGLQGYTPAPAVQVDVTVAINGTLTIHMTGNGQDATGAPFVGHIWTGVLDNFGVGDSLMLTPAAAGDRISDTTGVAAVVGGTATTGAFSLASVPDRTAP